MKNTLLSFCTFLFLCFASQNLLAQEVYTEFINPSFEGTPRPSKSPYGWYSYDFVDETPPDIHPTNPPIFGVSKKAYEGKTYVGIVTRENQTYESITQILTKPLIADTCYSLSIYLSQSDTYKSTTSWNDDKIVNFISPTVLKIWGGVNFEDELELLVQTPPINHFDWKKYNLSFLPEKDVTHLMIEASYENSDQPKNGHILLDNLSPISIIACEKENTLENAHSYRSDIFNKKIDLFNIIKKEGNKISLYKGKLEPSSEQPLKLIGEKLMLAEDYKLLFYYDFRNKMEAIARRKSITKTLINIGYSKDMFEVKPYTRNDNSKSWMIKEYDYLIGLEIK